MILYIQRVSTASMESAYKFREATSDTTQVSRQCVHDVYRIAVAGILTRGPASPCFVRRLLQRASIAVVFRRL